MAAAEAETEETPVEAEEPAEEEEEVVQAPESILAPVVSSTVDDLHSR